MINNSINMILKFIFDDPQLALLIIYLLWFIMTGVVIYKGRTKERVYTLEEIEKEINEKE